MLGNQTPTYSFSASYSRTHGPLAAELSKAYALNPHQWQRTVLNDWLALDDDGRLLNSLCLLDVSRQNGKALSLDTEIPTPGGWRLMRDIHVGDTVFGRDGKPSTVLVESPIFDKPMYRVTLDDGATVDASEDHIWTVQTKDTKNHEDGGWFERTTAQMAGRVLIKRRDGRREYRYRVPMNSAVEYPESDLPIDPYLLGAWLGDGTSKNATITISETDIPEMVRLFSERGEELTRLVTKDRAPMFRIGQATRGRYDHDTFYSRLRDLGVIRNKHIPDAYMVASVQQRWELLRGLMDTDGSCFKNGECEFAQKHKALCEQVLELCSSLGIKARMHTKEATCNGVPAGIAYRVTFFTDSARPCFNMERKRSRLKASIAYRTTYKEITSIERIPDAPSKCIAIDNESHLYLAGRRYTPTHNTGACDPRETWGLVQRGERILHTAQEYGTSKIAFDRLRAKFGAKRNDPFAKFPELNALVDRYTTSANQMVLDLKNGGHIEFRTRGNSDDVARGGTFDLVVVDEAQSYTAEQDAALSPLNSAAPSGSPQTILMGTVPNPERPHKGEVFAALRAAMVDNPEAGNCIHEWGVSKIGDVTDEARWFEVNPSLGYQLLVSGLRKDVRSMTPERFAREHLGWWDSFTAISRPILPGRWDACAIQTKTEGLVSYGVKFSPDGAEVVLCACVKPDDGLPHVERVKSANMALGLQWLVDFLTRAVETCGTIAIDGQSNAQELTERLLSARVPKNALMRLGAGDYCAACSSFVSAVNEGGVTHFNQDDLNESATGCVRRRINQRGGWGFASTDEVDATPIEAAAIAYRAAMTNRRDPSRRAVVW